MGKPNIILQKVTDDSLVLSLNGQVQEIGNQLTELKELLEKQQIQNIQYGDKIYNIEHINQANFDVVVGKKAFNEHLTKTLIEVIQPNSLPAQRFLEQAAKIANWESQVRISNKAKEIIAYSFVGVIGIQLSKLMAIGKEDFSEAKQRKYIQKCLFIGKKCLDLVSYAMLSKLWDARNQSDLVFAEGQTAVLEKFFDNSFEQSFMERFELIQVLCQLFSQQELAFPLPEIADIVPYLENDGKLHEICLAFKKLNVTLDKAQYNLLDCHTAERQLATFFKYFHFLANYKMASIKSIAYDQMRNASPHYLHHYSDLGVDSKANIDAEKIAYTQDVVHTDDVLLYQGQVYKKYPNLFPFVIDYNALTFEHGSKICFYHAANIYDNSLEYLFLEDSSVVNIEYKGILKNEADLPELLMNDANRKVLKLDNVYNVFLQARNTILGLPLDF